ncbi:MAG TPA: NAD(P)-dependent oxidoreductase [Gemmatimonadales bacterium]|nr:NAD(P)-dependent oxidoreductase [Gemmatimonadales bacterium]
MRVAFLGLGAIGRPMAVRVAKLHPTTVWNRTAERAVELARQTGARFAATPREAVLDADVVITCLPTSAEVEALLDGPDGLLAGFREGLVLADCTSGDPATSRRIADRLAPRGVAFLDAPVSGGTNGAEAGTLTVMVGGDEAALERARPALASFGSRIVRMGPVGAGHAMKSVNNALLAVNILAVAEGVTALVKAGVDARVAVETLNVSSGRSFVSEHLVVERVLTGSFPQTFRLALLQKDAGIAVDLLDDTGVKGLIFELAHRLLGEARAVLGEDADYLEAIKVVERQAGAEIRG